MAKKTRTPPPPRRPVQAPKRRVDARAPSESRKPLLYLVLFALSGLLILGGFLLWLTLKGGGDATTSLAPKMRAAGCTFQTYPDQGRKHFANPSQTFKYNSFPPTSGSHDPTPAIWNAYDDPVDQRKLVHNLEHGGIVIQYGTDVPAATVDKLREFYLSDSNGLILAPLPRLGDKIALTAWTHLSTCTAFNEGAFSDFRDAYRAKGPEPRRISDLVPGIAS